MLPKFSARLFSIPGRSPIPGFHMQNKIGIHPFLKADLAYPINDPNPEKERKE